MHAVRTFVPSLKLKGRAQVLREVVLYAYLPYLPYLSYGTQRTNIHNPMQAVCMLGVMRPCLLIGVHYAYLLTYLLTLPYGTSRPLCILTYLLTYLTIWDLRPGL